MTNQVKKIHVKTGDKVVVTNGRDRGVTGNITRVYPKQGKAIVQGASVVTRHQKPTQDSAGGLMKKEMPIDVSNLAHVDPKDGKATRIGRKVLDNGRKVRYAKRSGEVID